MGRLRHAATAVVIYITAVRVDGGTGHEHITDVRWSEYGTRRERECPEAEMIDWIAGKGGDVWVRDTAGREHRVCVVRSDPPHPRTRINGGYTDSLLGLPQF